MIKMLQKNFFLMLINHKVSNILLILSFLFYKYNGMIILLTGTKFKIKLLNGIKIYGNKKIVEKITNLVIKYSSI